jgi:hypothetical protein
MFTEGENKGVRLLSELTELVCCCHVDTKLTIALNKYFVARRGGFSGRVAVTICDANRQPTRNSIRDRHRKSDVATC